jgi:hypothetical protein
VIGRKTQRRRPREDFEGNVPRGAGGTSVYARTRARAALVRRRRVTDVVKTRSFIRGRIKGTTRPVNIVGRQYCVRTTGGMMSIAGGVVSIPGGAVLMPGIAVLLGLSIAGYVASPTRL